MIVRGLDRKLFLRPYVCIWDMPTNFMGYFSLQNAAFPCARSDEN